ncbi:hypothetical protein BN12_670002 [Nostocoides japonicum T1-X7]|uniref:Uncharacterized protein n=1 Tax=Nostocoides japonicum T1-X7 TaxID=1194083 RepID=A0A077M7B6_9MICO|nr:hypothetical protein [Tetrasphaera japonica]CCH79950.1 hypothetical protein BN12_670002 [Tetrasphaera japonica T1-X7]
MRLVVKVAIVGVAAYATYRAVRWVAPDGVGAFVAQVRAGASEREAQLREALGLDATDPHADDPGWQPRHGHGAAPAARGRLTPDEAKALLDDPGR